MPTEALPPAGGSHLAFIEHLFREYDELTLPLHGLIAADDKRDGSSVTRADREASTLVVQRLKAYAPESGIISEEEPESYRPEASWQWAIDPLDGTASFARALPVWGLGIGLLHHGDPVCGYLRFPFVRQTFTFEKAVGLFNGLPIAPSVCGLSGDTHNVMITSIHDHVDIRRVKAFRFHNLGSNLYHMMMLACGRCEAIITGPCYLWDLAPALPFTRAAGCIERYLDGSPLRLQELFAPDFGFPIRQPLLIGPHERVDELIARLV
jgi:fructose-1,6-bisphosphatase/inositol monophosphatase family enzyme